MLYYDDEDRPRRLWIVASLVETDDNAVDARATAQAGNFTNPPDNVSDNGQPSVTAAPTVVPNAVRILAYCAQKGVRPPRVAEDDIVYIEWSWYVSREEFMSPHLENAQYQVTLDGQLLDDYERYATEMKLEAGRYYVYWY